MTEDVVPTISSFLVTLHCRDLAPLYKEYRYDLIWDQSGLYQEKSYQDYQNGLNHALQHLCGCKLCLIEMGDQGPSQLENK